MNSRIRCVAVLAAAICTIAAPVSAFTIKEFRKYSRSEQAVYLNGAVSMVAFTYASMGDTKKARCVEDWYFGRTGVATDGPRQLTFELAAAEDIDPAKYHVEGVILGLTDKICGATK